MAHLLIPLLASAAFCQTAVPGRLAVATREVPPFAMKNEQGDWSGITIELLRDVMAELQDEAGQEITLEIREMGLDSMLKAVQQGEVDLAAAAITVDYRREMDIDFTHSFFNSGLGIAVGARHRQAGWRGILDAIFSKTFLRILLGLLAAMLLCAFAIYVFERRRNLDDFGGGFLHGLGDGLWWAAVTLTTVGYGDKVPKTVPGRLVGLIWMFTSLFIIASFTAAVTSALTVTQLKSRISEPRDLAGVDVATVKDSTSAKYLQSRRIRFQQYPDVTAALAAVKAGSHDAVVYDAPILKYEAYRHFFGDVFVLPLIFERQDYALALPTNSPLRERINLAILRKTGSPEWQEILREYLGAVPD